jgi:hypothetical protein
MHSRSIMSHSLSGGGASNNPLITESDRLEQRCEEIERGYSLRHRSLTRASRPVDEDRLGEMLPYPWQILLLLETVADILGSPALSKKLGAVCKNATLICITPFENERECENRRRDGGGRGIQWLHRAD